MKTKEKIKVFAIENNVNALDALAEIFDKNEQFEFKSNRQKGNDSGEVEQSRSEQKQMLMNILMKESFEILILDFLLRDTLDTDPEVVEPNDFKGIETVLSLEIVRQLKEMPEKQSFLPVFISSSGVCNTYRKFQKMKDKHRDKVPEEAIFIFKPEPEYENLKFENCPIYSPSNNPICKKEHIDFGGCSQKTCFLELLAKYYEEYTKQKNDK